VEQLLAADVTSVNNLQQLSGRICFLLPAAPILLSCLRPVFKIMAERLADTAGDKFARVRINNTLRDSITLFRQIRRWEGAHSWGRERHCVLRIYTDASMKGLGGTITTDDGVRHDWQEPIPRRYAGAHIQVLEALAVLMFLEHARPFITGRFIDLYVDNEAVRHALSWKGSRSPELNELIQQIYETQIRLRVTLLPFRVSTTDNHVADRLSRTVGEPSPVEAPIDHGDHRLNPQLFRRLQAWAGTTFSVDLMANSRNRQVHRFYAANWTDAPGFLGINCLAHDIHAHGKEFFYVNPPFAMMTAVLRFLKQSHATGVIVYPEQPLKPWFAEILAVANRTFLIATKGERDVFLQPSLGYEASVGPVPFNVWAALVRF
jgi:hypothetical protein